MTEIPIDRQALEALAPCPFCGSTDVFVQNAGWKANTFMRCPGCKTTFSLDNGTPRAHDATVAAWNRRTSPTTSPHAPEGVRDDVLEEAAKLCDDEADTRFANARKADAGDTSWGVDLAASASAQDNKAITARALGAAIRALKGNRT